ncbi:hypothetical protein FB567DRAFT_608505 [Paraphoma chrysanthemicola]|uniref:Heterokaryon incompatibility domain-containing protein n=1 Tax=Paraphoma chrysanthemicola TaxID=798071 RepID=A0A8K0R0A4_9PLEO|nr:hypothetical protein FB567DRAFT_608505 [Paraphoma chrysanthemicola]
MDERSSQVSIMDHIYSKADVVIVRLRGTRSFDEVFMPPLKHPEFLQCFKGYNSQCVPATPLTKACKHAEAIAMMRALFTTTINFQEWWARAWVVQEVVLARKDPVVLVGGYAVMWSHFVDVMDHLRQAVIQLPGHELQRLAKSPDVAAIKQELGLEASLERPVRGRQNIEIRSWEEAAQFMYSIRNDDAMGRNMSLGTILNTKGPHRQATDPLDNIYAYLSFLDLDTRKVIQIDYKKKPLQLYREIMALMLKKDVEQALMVIQTYSVKEHLFESDWPSWIPDFAVEDARNRNNSRGFAGRVKWRDARPVQISKDGRRIGLQGALIDTISKLHLVSSSHEIDPFEMWKATSFVKEAIGQPAPAGHWLRALDVLKECHVLNWMVGGSLELEDSDLEELWSALMRIGDPESRLSLVESYGS